MQKNLDISNILDTLDTLDTSKKSNKFKISIISKLILFDFIHKTRIEALNYYFICI